MKRTPILLAVAALTLAASNVLPQSRGGKFGIGLETGVRRIYGDRTNEKFGLGFGGLATYRILPFADIGLGLGYNQLKSGGGTTDLLNLDIKGNVEIVSSGAFRPYVTAGAGVMSFKARNSGLGRKSAAAFFGGGGIRLQFSPAFGLFLGTDYRFTTTDRFDSNIDEGKSKDGYFNVSSGFVYTLGGGSPQSPRVIADARAPFEQVDEYSQYFDDGGQSQSAANDVYGSGNQDKDMQEYVRLKSRVDKLSGDVGQRDQEIEELRRSLQERKQLLASLEGKASGTRTRKIARSSSMSGFSEIYQQALANFYNKEYSEALPLFRLLLQKYPNEKLASNCQYWVGQTLFSMGQYQQSIEELYKVLAFDHTPKRDDTLFLLGKAYLKTGDGDRARASFVQLMKDHPNSEFAAQAQRYIARL